MDGKHTRIVNVPSFNPAFIVVSSDWLKALVGSELGGVHDCYIAKISKNIKEIVPSRPHVRLTEYLSDE